MSAYQNSHPNNTEIQGDEDMRLILQTLLEKDQKIDPGFRSHQKEFLQYKDQFNTSITANREAYDRMSSFLNLQKEVLLKEKRQHETLRNMLKKGKR